MLKQTLGKGSTNWVDPPPAATRSHACRLFNDSAHPTRQARSQRPYAFYAADSAASISGISTITYASLQPECIESWTFHGIERRHCMASCRL